MTQAELIARMAELNSRNLATAQQKNSDYAGNGDAFKNFRGCERHGISLGQGLLVRMEDKMARLGNLLQKEPAVVGESVLDTALDLANYAVILAVWWDNERSVQKNVVGGDNIIDFHRILGGIAVTDNSVPPDGYNGNT